MNTGALRGVLDAGSIVDSGAADGCDRVRLDLTEVEFIDSTVVNALYGAAPRIRQYGGDLAIVVTDSPAARVLDLSGVDLVYRVAKTRKKALERLQITPDRMG